jgi:hypothetical protein
MMRVIETLAAYSAVAISNALVRRLRLYLALCQRNEDLALVNDSAAALTGSLTTKS